MRFIERIQRSNFGPLAVKKKESIDRLYQKYGNNYEFIIDAHPSTINRNLDEWYALLKDARRSIPF